jgi:hypothetical protein
MYDELSKAEKIAIFSILGIGTICIVWLLVLMLNTTPHPIDATPTIDNSKLEIELENKKLKALIDSLELVDSLHLIQLREKQNIINKKKHEIGKIIKFIPDADSKYKDSIWTVHFKKPLWGDSIE